LKSSQLQISELYPSIQGESSYAGWPCFFIRTAGCNLNCSYCDTPHARQGGKSYSLETVLQKVKAWPGQLVEVTGGEPLLQPEVSSLCRQLLQNNKRVLLETNGSLDIGKLPPDVIRIVDLKCPDSGMSDSIYWPNLEQLKPGDEIKFVLSSSRDYQWASRLIREQQLERKAQILLSAAQGRLNPARLAEWILKDGLTQVRLQLQLHKYIWPDKNAGV